MGRATEDVAVAEAVVVVAASEETMIKPMSHRSRKINSLRRLKSS